MINTQYFVSLAKCVKNVKTSFSRDGTIRFHLAHPATNVIPLIIWPCTCDKARIGWWDLSVVSRDAAPYTFGGGQFGTSPCKQAPRLTNLNQHLT